MQVSEEKGNIKSNVFRLRKSRKLKETGKKNDHVITDNVIPDFKTTTKKLFNTLKDDYTPTPFGGFLTFVIALLGLLAPYLYSSGVYLYYWNKIINLLSIIWNEIGSFFSKLF